MEVKSDFFLYKSGVYKSTNLAEPGTSGFHSVRIVGWGEESDGEPYWVRTDGEDEERMDLCY